MKGCISLRADKLLERLGGAALPGRGAGNSATSRENGDPPVLKTLRVTPAMAAGVTDHVWSMDEFYDRIMTVQEVSPPTPAPLSPTGTHRELPGGRGFLRVVPGR
jgi:hypothetical protein